nr:hypothetical protein [uncultured Pseudomonas sp.]
MNTKPTAVERIAGNLLTEATATLIAGAGVTVTPFAALLPILTNSLAAQRLQKRTEEALQQISLILQKHEEKLQHLSDEQYHVLIEAISATFQTINPEKLSHLKSAVRNSLAIEDLVPQESAVLARIIREISAEEADFIFTSDLWRALYRPVHHRPGRPSRGLLRDLRPAGPGQSPRHRQQNDSGQSLCGGEAPWVADAQFCSRLFISAVATWQWRTPRGFPDVLSLRQCRAERAGA